MMLIIVSFFISVNFTLSSAFKIFLILLNLNLDAVIVLFLFMAFELPSVKTISSFFR